MYIYIITSNIDMKDGSSNDRNLCVSRLLFDGSFASYEATQLFNNFEGVLKETIFVNLYTYNTKISQFYFHIICTYKYFIK